MGFAKDADVRPPRDRINPLEVVLNLFGYHKSG
jgi:hypothetical protein